MRHLAVELHCCLEGFIHHRRVRLRNQISHSEIRRIPRDLLMPPPLFYRVAQLCICSKNISIPKSIDVGTNAVNTRPRQAYDARRNSGFKCVGTLFEFRRKSGSWTEVLQLFHRINSFAYPRHSPCHSMYAFHGYNEQHVRKIIPALHGALTRCGRSTPRQ